MPRIRTSRLTREAWARTSFVLLSLTLGSSLHARSEENSEREAIAYFEREIRPLLAAHCYECHGPEAKRAKGGLRFTGRAALLAGGDSGPAISEVDPGSSLLLHAVNWTDGDLEMPPDGKLSADAITKLTTWVERGAVWPSTESSGGPEKSATPHDAPAIDIAKGRSWWSFRPIEQPAIPRTSDDATPAHPIDAFVRAELEKAGLQPSPEASRATLARRVYFDLIGLPPTKSDIDRFVADPREDAFERLVDELLARPAYGERWARHWLDVVRYADTNGYELDEPKPFAWRYRDYVIDSLNDDLPYDRFLTEQIAGDEIEPKSIRARLATGMLRIGAWDNEPDDDELATYDELDDSLRVITEGFLGVTVGCARCHDHKFDPIPQTDYYGMLGFLRSIRPYDNKTFEANSPALDILDRSGPNLARYERERLEANRNLQIRIDATRERGRKLVIRRRLEGLGESPEIVDLEPKDRTVAMRRALAHATREPITNDEIWDALGKVEARAVKRLLDEQRLLSRRFAGSVDWGLVVKEYGPRAIPTQLLIRGEPRSQGPEIQPHFPLALSPDDASATPHLSEEVANRLRDSTGRRTVLAQWIASRSNPLTARVIVNRVWHHHFGRGIVATPNDFGAMGDPPSHPALLDWLASEFMDHGWSLKWLHRTILASATWRQRSDTIDGTASAIDPENRLFWRQNPRRLEAEVIRDSMLAVCGGLDTRIHGPGFHPRLDRAVLAGSSRPGEGWNVSPTEDRSRRSIYAYVKRNLPIPFLETFDAANPTLPVGARTITTVSTQALTLLNGEFAGEIASRLAKAIVADESAATGDATVQDPAASIGRLFGRVLAREPTAEELAILAEYFEGERVRNLETAPTAIVESRIPRRIADEYLAKLSPTDVLAAPEDGFTVIRGRFGNLYNVTIEMNDLQGPAALWDAVEFAEGEVSARLRLRGDAPFGSVVIRASEKNDGLVGLELRIERDRARLLSHEETETHELGAFAASFAGRAVDLRARLVAGRISITFDGAESPAIDTADPTPGTAGRAGFRTRDAGIEVSALRVETGGARHDFRIPTPSAHERALAAVALVLVNSNEFVIVD